MILLEDRSQAILLSGRLGDEIPHLEGIVPKIEELGFSLRVVDVLEVGVLDRVDLAVFEVLVNTSFRLPLGKGIPSRRPIDALLDERQEALSRKVVRSRRSNQVGERWHQVDQPHELGDPPTSQVLAPRVQDQGHAKLLVVQVFRMKDVVMAPQALTMVRGNDPQGVVVHPPVL